MIVETVIMATVPEPCATFSKAPSRKLNSSTGTPNS